MAQRAARSGAHRCTASARSHLPGLQALTRSVLLAALAWLATGVAGASIGVAHAQRDHGASAETVIARKHARPRTLGTDGASSAQEPVEKALPEHPERYRSNKPIVIAHRGASGYLPEHTLPAKALAHAMGADFIEQDVVLSADGVPIVLHDIHLDATTDVASMFPGRARSDGRYYAIDFSLDEIRQLRAHERRALPNGEEAAFPQRFPLQAGLSTVPTLAEEIALIAGLDRSRGARTGLYIELKANAFHEAAGRDLVSAVLSVLEQSGYAQASDRVFLQSFEPAALQKLKAAGSTLPLIQLIGENSWAEDGGVDYDALRTDAGLAAVAEYAVGIGPWLMQIYQGRDADGAPMMTDLVQRAHAHGLLVHPYTFRRDQLPPGIDSYPQLLALFVEEIGIDGLFTDFPDLTRQFLDLHSAAASAVQENLP